ncbi:hypothetical protein [Phormidium tenue]|uniref:hypothetical protein n=1 Tax=Phormidium tenue TaxID=126344 RepID=UPI001F5515DB|nr:hypothetical protein [Phormidium tenue]
MDFKRKRSSYFGISYEVPLCLSQRDLAYAIHVPYQYQRVNEIIVVAALRLAWLYAWLGSFPLRLISGSLGLTDSSRNSSRVRSCKSTD